MLGIYHCRYALGRTWPYVGSTHRNDRREGGVTIGVTPKKQDVASKRKEREKRTRDIVSGAVAQKQVT